MIDKKIRVAAIQPPVPEGEHGHEHTVQRGLELVAEAAGAGAKCICLPEYFGTFGLSMAEITQTLKQGDTILERCRELARSFKVTIIYPSIEPEENRLFNTSWVIDSDGRVSGRYRKVHLTFSERNDKGLLPGNEISVFHEEPLSFGIMTCYDGCFPEMARILALQKAQVIFFPSLQRGATADIISLQVRSRAFDNCVYIVRSSYGYPIEIPWKPGMMVGMSCVADWEGRIIADLGYDEGFVLAEIPLEEPRFRFRSFEGNPESPKSYLFEDRRPELYKPLCAYGKMGLPLRWSPSEVS